MFLEHAVMSSNDNIPMCQHHTSELIFIFLYFRVGSLHINSSGKVDILSPPFASKSSKGRAQEIYYYTFRLFYKLQTKDTLSKIYNTLLWTQSSFPLTAECQACYVKPQLMTRNKIK